MTKKLPEYQHRGCLVDMPDEFLTIGFITGKDPAVFFRLVLLFEFQCPQYAVEVNNGRNLSEFNFFSFNCYLGIDNNIRGFEKSEVHSRFHVAEEKDAVSFCTERAPDVDIILPNDKTQRVDYEMR